MCYDSDLFGDVIVTVNEVNIWLDATAHLRGRSLTSRNYYAEHYDVAKKIKLSKLDGSFYKVINEYEQSNAYDDLSINCFNPVYVADDLAKVAPVCPDYYHVCDFHDCPVFIARAKREKNAADYERRKKYKVN